MPGRTRHPDDVALRARFTGPSGRTVTLGGFAAEGRFKVRFSPTEPGRHVYTIDADGGSGFRRVAEGALRAVLGPGRGFIRRHPRWPHRLAFADGTTFLPLGENRFNVYDPSWNHGKQGIEDYIASMARSGMNTLRVFVFTDAEAEGAPGGRQPGCLEPRLGRFDEAVARDYDRIFAAAEAHGVHVVLTAFAVGFTPGDVWKGWEDNPYSAGNRGPARENWEFFHLPEARRAALRRLRYIVDRWGSSPSLLAIDLVNEPEWDGAIPEEMWIPWAEAMAGELERIDPYDHLVTVGSVGLHWNVEGDDRPWYGSPRNDIVQWHLYGKETYDVHALAAEMTRKVRETWRYGKPVLVGEFGYGGDDPATYDHTHVGIWSATFAGAGVLAHSAPPFTPDSDLPMTPERARHFRVLADFLARLDRKSAFEPLPDPRGAPEGLRVWTMGAGTSRALWLLAPAQRYGEPVKGATVEVRGLSPGTYLVEWWDDVQGERISAERIAVSGRAATIEVPVFVRHLAAVIRPA